MLINVKREAGYGLAIFFLIIDLPGLGQRPG
jgi:hypothetical protein